MEQPESQYRILIVDDTPENIDVLGELLSDYKRTFARDGTKALEKVRNGQGIDLILLDVMMPGINGFEVCRQLKADRDTRDIPVIFVTSLEDETIEAKGLSVGAVDYITKPFKPEVIRARVRTHLELKHAKQQLATQNTILEEKVKARTAQLYEALREIKESSLETIVRLSRAAEYKDDDTGAHVLRMSRYSAAVARQLGMNDEEAHRLLYAAPMHDIGKIGIPDRILLKPGKLNEQEWQIMRRHCKMGANILRESKSDLIALGEVVAMTHHEKWDGTGYPRQLRGEEIPLIGRIVAIADVFDALSSKRPYKEPFSVDKSFSIIEESKGSHFDPRVVEAFMDIEQEILRIRTHYQTEDNDLFAVSTMP